MALKLLEDLTKEFLFKIEENRPHCVNYIRLLNKKIPNKKKKKNEILITALRYLCEDSFDLLKLYEKEAGVLKNSFNIHMDPYLFEWVNKSLDENIVCQNIIKKYANDLSGRVFPFRLKDF